MVQPQASLRAASGFAWNAPPCSISRSPSPCSTRSTLSGGSSRRAPSPSLLSDASRAPATPPSLARTISWISTRPSPCASPRASPRASPCASPRASPRASPCASPRPSLRPLRRGSLPMPAFPGFAARAVQRFAPRPQVLQGLADQALQGLADQFRLAAEEVAPPPSPTKSSVETLQVTPGDVLFIRGVGGFTGIGTTGGYFGHFLVVVSAPEPLSASEVQELREYEADLVASRAWKVETVESTRSHRGLHRSQHVIYAEPRTGCLRVAAELLKRRDGMHCVPVEREPLQLWRSPPEARAKVTPAAVRQVLADMKACQQNWSLATAAKAVLMSASVRDRAHNGTLLEELSACWQEAPICTSIVVIFWQRLLGVVASRGREDHLGMVLKWLPLKADRGLPGELVTTLEACGWQLEECL